MSNWPNFLSNFLDPIVNGDNNFSFISHRLIHPKTFSADIPLKDPSILLSAGCHVDHEGFDLNEIEQAYYRESGIALSIDNTWYKDGDGERVTSAVLQPWIEQTNIISNQDIDHLIVDHSHFVFKYPIRGEAAKQIKKFIPERPELARLLSTRFKCGLDICIDLLSKEKVQPIVHIEWDFVSVSDMEAEAFRVAHILKKGDWQMHIRSLKEFNYLYGSKLDAFTQANVRSLLIFGEKSYRLIPTL